MRRCGSHRRRAGFTLIEVLVALAIFAVTAIAVQARMGDMAVHGERLAERTFASWIAGNQLAQMALELRQPEWLPVPGSRREEVQFGGQQWRVDHELTPEPGVDGLYRADIQVFLIVDRQAQPTGTLRGYLARPE